MLNNNDTVIVHVGDSNPQQANKDASVSLDGGDVQINVQVNHEWSQIVKPEEQTGLDQIIQIQVSQAIPSLGDSTLAKIKQTGYNALSKNDNPGGDTESYQNYDLVQFSDGLKNQLQSGKNYPIYLTVEFDNLEQPVPLDFIIHIPGLIQNVFPGSFKIIADNGYTFQVKESQNIDLNAYSSSLSEFITTSVVV